MLRRSQCATASSSDPILETAALRDFRTPNPYMLPYWYGSHRLAASARWRCTEPLRPGVGIGANEPRLGSGRSDHAPTNARTCR
jgi:hypothetical protein